MANIAAYPDWYTRSGMTDYRTEITEVVVVNSYDPTGHELVSWDASAELNGTVTAYIVKTKLVLVCDSLTAIPDKMFLKFLSLEKISGLQTVRTIGAWAFMLTPKLSEIDLAWDSLTAIGNDAFRISSIEDNYDLSNLASDVVCERATRSKRWSSSGLAAVRAVTFPGNKICLNVSNADSQRKYADVPYATVNGEVKTVAQAACRTLSCYHIWNTIYAKTDKEYPDFITWFNDKLNRDGKYHENTDMGENCRKRDYATLGWVQDSVARVISSAQLEYIVSELSNGLPVYATMQGTGTGYHSVVIIGCDPVTRKLAIVDSDMRTDKGVIYWVAYEDVFTEGSAEESECIRKIDFNLPLLAKSDTWFTQGEHSINRSSITEIDIALSYTPTGNETVSWDASAKKNGSVMCYLNGTKLTIAGNGDNYVYANLDSNYAFSDSTKKDYYSKLTNIYGGNLLNTRNVINMSGMFRACSVMIGVDTKSWDTSSVEKMTNMFNRCRNLAAIDVSGWDTSSVTSMDAIFNMEPANPNTKLTSIDVSKWDTSNATSMIQMFSCCTSLEELDVSNWNVSKVTSMYGIFNGCHSLKTIGNVANWKTESCTNMYYMFNNCMSLEELNTSNWDTSVCADMTKMLFGMSHLKKFTIGKNFSFKNNAVLPTPDPAHISGADGNWYDVLGNSYTPSSIPSNTRRTYYASLEVMQADSGHLVLIKNGTLMRIAEAIRSKSGKTGGIIPSQFAAEIIGLP